MDMLRHLFIFIVYFVAYRTNLSKKYSRNFPRTYYSQKAFSLDNDLRSKLVKNNKRINDPKDIFLSVLSLLFVFYIYLLNKRQKRYYL